MPEWYTDRFLRQGNSDKEIQGLYVKLAFFKDFLPLRDVKEIPEEPDMLHIIVSSKEVSLSTKEPCDVHYFVHKSQVIFRTIEAICNY